VWHSGWPYTPQNVRVDTLINNPPQLRWYDTVTPGDLFGGRVPAYKRVDVRWTRFVDTKHGKLVAVSLSEGGSESGAIGAFGTRAGAPVDGSVAADEVAVASAFSRIRRPASSNSDNERPSEL